MQRELQRRTWRWFLVRLNGLSSESNFLYALYPPDPETGQRSRRPSVITLDDVDAVDAFFARQAD